MEDHRRTYPVRRRTGWGDHFPALKSRFEVVDFEGNVRHGFDDFSQRAIRIKPHPFDAIRAGAESGHMYLELGEIFLIRSRNGSGYADVMIAPAQLGDSRGRLIVAS